MQPFSRVATDHRKRSRSGAFSFESLRELGLLCGGMAVVMAVLLLVTRDSQIACDRMTTAFRAEAAGKASPSLPVYGICVQTDQQSAWLRRGRSSLHRVSLTDGALLDEIPVFSSDVSASAHSLDGHIHAYATLPKVSLVVIRDGVTCIEEHYANQTEVISALTVTPDGSRVASVKDNDRIMLWNLAVSPPGRTDVLVESPPVKVSWSAGGDLLLCACSTGLVKIISTDGRTVWERDHLSERPTSVAWAPEGDRVSVGTFGGELAVLNASNGDLLWQSRLDGSQVMAVSFSTDGNLLATGDSDCTVNIFSAESGQPLLKLPGHYDLITAVQFLPDGDRILSASYDGTLRIWSLSEKRELQKL